MSFLLVLHVLKKRLWIIGVTFAATLFGAILVILLVPARYDGVATASIDPNLIDPVSGLPTAGANSLMIVQGNLVALAKSNQVALAVIKRLNLDADPAIQADYRSSSASGTVDIRQWFADKLEERLDARFAPGSNVLSITYKGASAEQAALFANTFMSAFIDAAIAQKVTAAQKTAEWFAPQIEKLRSELGAAREKLSRFQLDSKILAANAIADPDNTRLINATNDLAKAKADLVVMQGQYASPAPTAATSNETQAADVQTLNALRATLANAEAEIAQLQSQIGPNNPKMQEKVAARKSLQKQIDDQILDIRRKLADRIVTQKAKIATLESVYDAGLKSMIDVQSEREKMDSLKKDELFRQEELERALKTENQARLQSQLSFSNVVILDRAAPPSMAAFPKKIIVLPLAFGLGLVLGALFALIAEALDRRMRDAEDLVLATGAASLGSIPYVGPPRTTALARATSLLRLQDMRAVLPARNKQAAADARRANGA